MIVPYTSCLVPTDGSVRKSTGRDHADVSQAIERDLERGITVVADRYAFSGISFSAAKVCGRREPS
jgi:hypothetical protein